MDLYGQSNKQPCDLRSCAWIHCVVSQCRPLGAHTPQIKDGIILTLGVLQTGLLQAQTLYRYSDTLCTATKIQDQPSQNHTTNIQYIGKSANNDIIIHSLKRGTRIWLCSVARRMSLTTCAVPVLCLARYADSASRVPITFDTNPRLETDR